MSLYKHLQHLIIITLGVSFPHLKGRRILCPTLALRAVSGTSRCLIDIKDRLYPRLVWTGCERVRESVLLIYCCDCAAAAAAESLQSCPTLCDPIDGSPPGSPVPGILQARTLEWVAISFSNAGK